MGGPGRPGMNTQAKAKNFKATTKKLINNYLSKYKLAITITSFHTWSLAQDGMM